MKDVGNFIQTNFGELLLALIIVGLVFVLIMSIHWHDDSTAAWARGAISGVILSIATLLSKLKMPEPNGTVTMTTTTDKSEEDKK